MYHANLLRMFNILYALLFGNEVFVLWKWLGAGVNGSIVIVFVFYMMCSIFCEQSCSMELCVCVRVCVCVCGSQLVKIFPAFYGTRRFITTFTSARQLCLSWASSIQSVFPQPNSWRPILILSTHLHLGLPSGFGNISGTNFSCRKIHHVGVCAAGNRWSPLYGVSHYTIAVIATSVSLLLATMQWRWFISADS